MQTSQTLTSICHNWMWHLAANLIWGETHLALFFPYRMWRQCFLLPLLLGIYHGASGSPSQDLAPSQPAFQMVPEWTLGPETSTEIEKSVTPLLNALECVGSMGPGPRRLGPVGLERGISICWSLGPPAAFPPEPRLGERCMFSSWLPLTTCWERELMTTSIM